MSEGRIEITNTVENKGNNKLVSVLIWCAVGYVAAPVCVLCARTTIKL